MANQTNIYITLMLTGAVLLAADGIQEEEDETDILPTVYDNIEEDEVGGYTLLIYKLLQQNPKKSNQCSESSINTF